MSEPQLLDRLPARTTVAIAIFVACCLLSSLRLVINASIPGHTEPDDIAKRSDQRFASVKRELPDHGVIGYVGDTAASAIPNYYLTQYALAPLVVERSAKHKIVIGNFPAGPPPSLPSDLRVIKDFGNGVLLLSGEDAR